MSATSVPAATGAARTSGLGYAFGALRHRDFRLFWIAALASNTGTWLQGIAAPFVLYRITGSTTWLGIGAFCSFAPSVVLGPLAGSLADRIPRRQIVLVCQSISMAVAVGLWALWSFDLMNPVAVVGLLFVSGCASGINLTSWQAFVPQLVPPDSLPQAVRLNSFQFTLARALGPALAGVVLSQFGPGANFAGNALSFVLVIVALLMVSPRPLDLPPPSGRVRDQFRAGLSYVRAQRALLVAVLTILLVGCCGMAVIQLTPAIASQQFGVGRAAYGFLVSSYGLGAIGGSLIVSIAGERLRKSSLTTLGLALFGVGVMVLGVSSLYVIGLLGTFVMGIANASVGMSLNTAVQMRVAEAFRGRVMAVYLMCLMGGVPLGALVLGRVASVFSLEAALIGAATVLLLAAATALAAPRVMRSLDDSRPLPAPV